VTEAAAKKHLRSMLRSFTPGSILHLLSELFRESAEQALQAGDEQKSHKLKAVEDSLFVLGLGIDAVGSR
jgi:hypothetical protein